MGEVAGIRAVCDAPAHVPTGIGAAEGTVEERFVGVPGGLFPDDPAIPPPSRAAVDRARARALGAAASAPRPPPRRTPSCSPSARPRTSTRRTRSTRSSSSGYEAFQLTYNLLTEFDKDAQPGPGLRRHLGALRRPGHVPHPGRDEVVRRRRRRRRRTSASRGASRWPRSRTTSTSARLPRPGRQGRGRHQDRVPRRRARSSPTRPTSRTGSSRSTCRSCPSTSGASTTTRRSPRRSSTPPLVGTGPYTLAEWKTGQFARFVRNPNYWGNKGFADEVVLRFFPDDHGRHGPGPEGRRARLRPRRQRRTSSSSSQADPTYTAVAGKANGWTQLAFNTYGTGTGKTIQDGGPSTKALLDPAFRDALGYAVDHQALVDRVLGGFGDVGTTIVPPVLSDWHVEPDNPRHFDIELAKQKLDAAGYHARRQRQAARQGGQADRPAPRPSRTPTTATRSPPSSCRSGTASSASTSRVQSYDSDTLDEPGPAARAGDGQGRIRHRAVGLGRQPGPERRCSDRVPLRRRSATCRTASTATRRTTSCTTSSRRRRATRARRRSRRCRT